MTDAFDAAELNVDVLPDGRCVPAISDEALWALTATLHSNVPESERPMSWSDFSPEQIERLRLAAKVFLGSYIAAPTVTTDVRKAVRLLNKIVDLAYDEDVGEPLDDAIGYAQKALAALSKAGTADVREADKDRLISRMAFAMQTAQGALQNSGRNDLLEAALSSLTIALNWEAEHWQKYATLSQAGVTADVREALMLLGSVLRTDSDRIGDGYALHIPKQEYGRILAALSQAGTADVRKGDDPDAG